MVSSDDSATKAPMELRPRRNERVLKAISALAAGGMVVVTDDEDRENEGDLVMVAEDMTTADMVFFLRHGSGIVCVTMDDATADRLRLPLMVARNTDNHGTAFTTTVDHCSTGTGISARDRATTVLALADPDTKPEDLRRPGHVFPLRAQREGVLRRAGHTEASVDLVRLAGRGGIAVITELVGDDGVPLSGQRLAAFVAKHALPRLSISELIRHRRGTESVVERVGDARLPTDYGTFHAWAYRSASDGVEHLALTMGDPAGPPHGGTLVRVHSECVTGDLFSSQRCDCGTQLDAAMRLISEEGVGVVVYLRGHEGRGIGLGHKLRAYRLQEAGRDTVDANLDLGFAADQREYGVGAAILADLGVSRIRLITNNPDKYGGLDGYDLTLVERVAHPPRITADNLAYLTTKRDRLGHLIDLPDPETPEARSLP